MLIQRDFRKTGNFLSFWDAIDFILKVWRAKLTLILLRLDFMNWPTYRPVRWKLGQPRIFIKNHHESLSDEFVINWGNLRFELVLFFKISRSNTSNTFLLICSELITRTNCRLNPSNYNTTLWMSLPCGFWGGISD